VPLTGEWALWRDIAVRSAGFPVSGLGVFGSRDEQAGLRAVARDPLFQRAVTWQNRAAMRNAVAKIATGGPRPRQPSAAAGRGRRQLLAAVLRQEWLSHRSAGGPAGDRAIAEVQVAP
jgi:hypothetical protein